MEIYPFLKRDLAKELISNVLKKIEIFIFNQIKF